ncbi:hypothetical protein MJO29_014964 [Puccinia striiformis f. sp. tritici]|nr:hypothetical protein MJO29_014964 [Puccinia striiformis f. sp. tritici]
MNCGHQLAITLAMTGVHHTTSTIHNNIRSRLQLFRKVVMTLHPGKSVICRANYSPATFIALFFCGLFRISLALPSNLYTS